MNKTKIIGIAIGILFIIGFLVFYAIPISNGQNLNQNQLYQISQIANYCQSLCYYAEDNLSINNLNNECLISNQSVLSSYWNINGWGCQVSNNYQSLCGYNNYVILDNNCSIVSIYYNNKNLNLT
ncbi:hypothetical protein MJ1_0514 [Nanobdella aerobiophila]|uniref:Transmembrane protein n=1 Tax=Nanobdella aerobiophila TaxID=2586965 RepID=A0A915SAC7_9ARCH|nr:hypothetical protein [Nanobdella aerobiophila]BBL45667.1 hypothetical protein MJ1_0514 [Nanobdella aerobiophila]